MFLIPLSKNNFSGSTQSLIYLRQLIDFDEINRAFFIISNASLESGFKPSHSVCHFSIFPFQMTIANIWWVSCEVFSNVQKNFTCRMDLASMRTNIFIRHLVKVGIETRKLNPRNYFWLYVTIGPRKLQVGPERTAS